MLKRFAVKQLGTNVPVANSDQLSPESVSVIV